MRGHIIQPFTSLSITHARAQRPSQRTERGSSETQLDLFAASEAEQTGASVMSPPRAAAGNKDWRQLDNAAIPKLQEKRGGSREPLALWIK